MSGHSSVNPDVLRAWCEAPSHFLQSTPEHAAPPGDPQSGGGSPQSSPRRHRYTPAEISQQSVDLLLREYYKLVTSQRHSSSMHEGEASHPASTAFLLACPAPPACLELDHLLKAARTVVQLAARAVALSACLLVPVLLGVIRQVQGQQGPRAAAAVAVGGLLLLLLCDQISRRAVKRQAAAQAVCVTAANLQQHLQAGGPTHELATLRAVSQTATTPNSSRPGSITSQQAGHTARQQLHSAGGAAAAGRGSAGGGSGAVSSYAALQPDLAALQSALGVKVSSRHPAGSREHVVETLTQLCQQYGVQVTPDMTATPQAAATTVAQLKQNMGI